MKQQARTACRARTPALIAPVTVDPPHDSAGPSFALGAAQPTMAQLSGPSRRLRWQHVLLLAALLPGIAEGARSRVQGPCRPACAHDGLCLPRGGGAVAVPAGSVSSVRSQYRIGLEAWGCYCKAPWTGPTCSGRADVESIFLQGDSAETADPGTDVNLAKPALPAPPAVSKQQMLKNRLHELQSRLHRLERHPENALRMAFYRALCQGSPCPLGLGPANFRVLGAEGAAIHLGVAPSPGTAPLGTIVKEVEDQLANKDSPLRRAGGSELDVETSQLGLWFAKPSARVHLHRLHPTMNEALEAFTAFDHWQEPSRSGNVTIGSRSISQNETDAAEIAGVKKNTADDLAAFLYALGLNSGIVLACTVLLSFLRRAFPTVYEGNGLRCESSFFGWIWVSYRMTTQEVMDKAGLDHAMLVEFMNLSMRIMVVVGLPLVLVMAPLHYWCGGGAAGEDTLSWISMGNVQQGSWLCWVHAFMVWYVVIATQKSIFLSMRRDFIPKRFRFLKDMPEPRATSVLVEGIPDAHCKEDSLKRYFDDGVFGRRVVKHAYFVKQTADLQLQRKNLQRAKDVVEKAKLRQGDPLRMARLEKTEREVEQAVEELRRKIINSDDDNSRNAFITFETRRDAAIALKLFGPEDAEEIIVSIPPDPSDIIWADLLVDPNLQAFREIIGYILIVTLLVTFMPIVVYIARIASLDNVKETVPFFESLVNNYPKLATLWNGLVGSAALSIMMSCLPTLLVLIIGNLFVLRAQAWLQLHLQGTYFYFLVLYVLLVTTIGSSLIETARYLAQHPMELFVILADKMPSRTHFYLSYLSVQWGTHAINMLRYVNLFKFLALALVYDKTQAKEWSEPEDQDYHGMGSRSARNTLLLVITIVFCTLTPLITIIGFLNFGLSKMIFTYTVVFSETKKADLGGVFWFESLKHVQQGLFLYVALMTGVLMERASSLYPAAITVLCLLYCFSEYRYFMREFRWELLEFHELRGERSELLPGVSYKQPELISAEAEEPPESPEAPQEGPFANLFQALQRSITGASCSNAGSRRQPSGRRADSGMQEPTFGPGTTDEGMDRASRGGLM